jgi:hypothetical protein
MWGQRIFHAGLVYFAESYFIAESLINSVICSSAQIRVLFILFKLKLSLGNFWVPNS